jgi:hypothetical protein
LDSHSTNAFATGTTALRNFADLTTAQTVSNKLMFGGSTTNMSIGASGAWITNAYFYGALNVSNDTPTIIIHDTDAPTDEKNTVITTFNGDLNIVAYNDAYDASDTILSVDRTGYALDRIYIEPYTEFNSEVQIFELLTVPNITLGGGTIYDAILLSNTYSGTISRLTNGTIVGSTVTNGTYYGTVGLLSGGYMNGVASTNMVATNATLKGVSIVPGGMNFERSNYTSFANGANAAAAFGDVTFVKIKAGPTGAFSIAGIASGANGKRYILYNATGQNMTISNDSGTDPTPANRIYTGTGADIATTGNGVVEVVYDSEDSRWIVTAVRD